MLRKEYGNSVAEMDKLKLFNEILSKEKQCLEDEIERFNGHKN